MTAMTVTVPSTATTCDPVRSGRRRRPRPRPPEPQAWTCENCAQANVGRRRRCGDCGTTRC